MNSEQATKPYYLDDHTPGEVIECGEYYVDQCEAIEFASRWDPQPWHIDAEAAKDSLFGGLTACSAHIFSIFCVVSPQWKNGAVMQAMAGLGFDEMRMHKPVYAGDTVRCVSTVDSVRVSGSKPDRGIVVYASQLLNQHGDRVFSVKTSVLVSRDPAGAAQ